ncbi:hypothetical protein T06_14988 [Trichinella sp. T6]|nr:hypothetical protein T06_14988 [Trichinella sp. T6]
MTILKSSFHLRMFKIIKHLNKEAFAELLYLTSCKDLFTDTIKQRSEEQLSEKEKEKHFTLMM